MGQSAQVAVDGKFTTWPCEVTCDREDVQVAPQEEQGKFTIKVSDDAPQGIAWLRFYDKSVVSKWMPLLVESSSVVIEKEKNDRIKDAEKVQLPASVNGRLNKSEDVDCFSVDLAKGQQLRAQVIANQILKSPMDAVIQLVDMRGNVLDQRDDQRGRDPQLFFEVPADGTYVLRIFAFPETPNSTIGFSGGADFIYLLRLSTEPMAEFFLPIVGTGIKQRMAVLTDGRRQITEWRADEPGNISPTVVRSTNKQGWQWASDGWAASAKLTDPQIRWDTDSLSEASKLPAVFSGVIESPGEIDRFRVDLSKGKKYSFRLYSQELGFQLDSRIHVVGPDGANVASNDDRTSRKYDSSLELTAKVDGIYEVQIEDLAASSSLLHAYSLIVQQIEPAISLALASDRFTLKGDSELEIPVLVTRTGGYSKKLGVKAIDLPKGVSCEEVVSEAKGGSSKSVKLKLKLGENVEPGHYKIQVQARDMDNSDEGAAPVIATFALRNQVQIAEVWLSVVE